jgi:hypothetical protein
VTEQELEKLANDFNAAWNARDAERVLSFFADNGVARTLPAPPVSIKSIFNGKDQILGFVQAHMPGFKVEVSNLKAEGNKASWNFRAWSETFAQMGVSPSSGVAEIIVNPAGKITLFTINFDEQTVNQIRSSTQKAADSAS